MNELVGVLATLTATKTTGEIVKLLVNTYVKPKIELLNKKRELDKEFNSLIEDKFSEYIERSYNKYLYMNTIVFRNQQKTVDDLYIPLTLEKVESMKEDKEEKIFIDGYKEEFIGEYKKILIVDTAGMGKSTIIRYLFISSIRENAGIPVLIELRKLKKEISIVETIMNELNGISEYFNEEYILSLIKRGDFIFFFDGYDEIIEEDKKDITEKLEEFISKTNNNLFILSSRDENELNCFGDFQRFNISRLKKKEAFNLIKKYDAHNDGKMAEILIKKLENEENLKIINEFLVNPLMVSLLYKAFEYKGKIPYKKYVFYRQVYDALFEDHDMTKGSAYAHKKRSKLDSEDFHRMLRCLGYLTLAKGKINFSKEELYELLAEVKKRVTGIEVKECNLINDLIVSVPLFIEDGIEYKWAHKSFQEYFAASYICMDIKDKKDNILIKMAENKNIKKYFNVLDFCYDIDIKTFRECIIYPMVTEFINHYNKVYINKKFENYDKFGLLLRRNITFISKDIKIVVKDSDKSSTGIEKFIEFFGEDYKGIGDYVSITTKVDASNNGVGFLVAGAHYTKLIKLIFNKQISIVRNLNKTFDIDIFKDFEEGEYRSDENILNPLNNSDSFKEINKFMIDKVGGLYLDYNECLKFKEQVEMENESCKEDILLV